MQFVVGVEQTRRVEKYDLALRTGEDTEDASSGCLGLGGDNGEPLTEKGIEEGRFSRVRAAGEGDVADTGQFRSGSWRRVGRLL